jgi:hypothetical protein
MQPTELLESAALEMEEGRGTEGYSLCDTQAHWFALLKEVISQQWNVDSFKGVAKLVYENTLTKGSATYRLTVFLTPSNIDQEYVQTTMNTSGWYVQVGHYVACITAKY